MPSEVVVPVCRPASIRMWLIRRVVVLLPFVPLIDTIGIVRSASRIQPGGVAVGRRRSGPPSGRAGAAGRRSGGPSGPARRCARRGRRRPRLIERARPAAVHGNVTIQWPGSDERWTARPARPAPWSARRRLSQATRAATSSGQSRAGTGRPSRTRACRAGLRWPYHVRRRPIATSTLTTGSSR